jgi:hypothetical protein
MAGITYSARRENPMNARKALCKFTTFAAIALVLVGGHVWPVHANHLNFTLYNQSSQSIRRLYVSPASSDKWGNDVLGTDILRSGRSTRITFPGQNIYSSCLWDIKVVYSNGSSAVNRFDLCEVNVVTAH